jgi:ABC-type transporter Mla MlaB component
MDTEKPRKPRAPRKSKAGASANGTDVMNTQTAPEQPAKPNGTLLRLDSSLQIKDVENVHRQLLDILAQGLTVTVDISHVAAMDTAGVQLLLAFQTEAEKRAVAIEYSGQSTAFTHALTAVGLGDAVRHVASRD